MRSQFEGEPAKTDAELEAIVERIGAHVAPGGADARRELERRALMVHPTVVEARRRARARIRALRRPRES